MAGWKRRLLADQERRQRAATLGDLQAAGIDVFCWCNRCGHNAVVACEPLAGQLGPAFPVPELGAHMRCSGCASKDVATRPAWPSLGQVTRHS